jgi:hypothetical protein
MENKNNDKPNLITNKNDKVVLVSMISGLLSGAIAKIITHPIDTIKAKVQIETKSTEKISHAFSSTIKSEGIKGLYRGIGISVFGSIPACCLYFGTYEWAKKNLLFLNYLENAEFLKYFIGGIIAETVSCLIFVPVDIIKERRQVQSKLNTYHYKNDFDAFRQIIKKEKIRGIYRAYGATIVSFGPMSAFYFMFYEYFKGFFVKNDAKTYWNKINKVIEKDENLNEKININIGFTQSLLCASLASGLSSYITTPLDLVKFRMQVQRSDTSDHAKLLQYKNVVQGLISIGYTEGFKGLFWGATSRVFAYTPTGAISMTVLEFFKPRISKLID